MATAVYGVISDQDMILKSNKKKVQFCKLIKWNQARWTRVKKLFYIRLGSCWNTESIWKMLLAFNLNGMIFTSLICPVLLNSRNVLKSTLSIFFGKFFQLPWRFLTSYISYLEASKHERVNFVKHATEGVRSLSELT